MIKTVRAEKRAQQNTAAMADKDLPVLNVRGEIFITQFLLL
jgi:hypothetical protein